MQSGWRNRRSRSKSWETGTESGNRAEKGDIASENILTVVRLTHIGIYNGSNPEFIAKAWKIILQTRAGNQNSYQFFWQSIAFDKDQNVDYEFPNKSTFFDYLKVASGER